MRFIKGLAFLVLASGLMTGQTSTSNTNSAADSPNVADEIKKLRDALAEQQKQIAVQQQEIEKLRQKVGGIEQVSAAATTGASPRLVNAGLSNTSLAVGNPSALPASDAPEDKPKDSPLSFRIGGTEFTPGGFVDFENIFRTTNTGNVTATNFWAIPFSNTVAGHLTEYRATGQYSRFSLKVNGKYGENNVLAYLEGDFNGNDAANVFVTSNPHTNRLRLYWVDLKRGKWEFLGGQSWGMMTANRTGLSPMPSDLALTTGEDAQVHVGINYTRAAQFRAVYHFNDNFQWGAAIENPQQFIGQGNEVIFPSAFNAALGGQFDNAAVPGAPNAFPDIMTKMAYDKNFGSRKFHWEGGGLMTSAKIAVIPTVAGATFSKHSKVGGGIETALSFDILPKVKILGNGLWGNGVGRYLIGTGPQAVVVPTVASGAAVCTSGATGGCDARLSMVHAGNMTIGTEIQAHPKTLFGFYYGGVYFQRNAFQDLTLAAKPLIGFGAPGAAGASIMNRDIQEGTFDWTQTFWKNPQYGAVLMISQTSYVTRSPWFVPLGAPKNAHLLQQFLSLRYVLP